MIGLLEIYEILIGSTLVLFGWDTWGYLTRFVTLGGYTMPLVVWVEKRSVLMLVTNVGLQAEDIKTFDCPSGGYCDSCDSCRDGSPSGTSLRVPPRSLRENREIWPCPRSEVQAARRHIPGLSIARLVSSRSGR